MVGPPRADPCRAMAMRPRACARGRSATAPTSVSTRHRRPSVQDRAHSRAPLHRAGYARTRGARPTQIPVGAHRDAPAPYRGLWDPRPGGGSRTAPTRSQGADVRRAAPSCHSDESARKSLGWGMNGSESAVLLTQHLRRRTHRLQPQHTHGRHRRPVQHKVRLASGNTVLVSGLHDVEHPLVSWQAAHRERGKQLVPGQHRHRATASAL